ncbi:MAG: GFA family protein, partial [Rhizorhabdus sp.]
VGDEPLEILDCNCSICSMTGFLHLIVPDVRFRLLEGKEETTTYRFGSGKARHIFCSQCGIKSFYRPRSHPEGISISLRCIDEWQDLKINITPFEGRDWGKGENVPGS